MSQETVDFGAIGRVSQYSELKDIRLSEVSAKCDPKGVGPLESEVSHQSSLLAHDNESLQVKSLYRFLGRTADTQAVEIIITYLVVYSLKAPQPLAEEDLNKFAAANGTLHSWPFVREFLHGLTSRMGFPPFKLGVMHFVALQPEKKPAEGETVATEKSALQPTVAEGGTK